MMTDEELQEAREYATCQEYDCPSEDIIKRLLLHIDELTSQIATLKAALTKYVIDDLSDERLSNRMADGGYDSRTDADLEKEAKDQLANEYPEIFAEIKRLRVLECAAKANTTRRDEDIGDLMKELVKWQQIAIDRTAQIGWYTSCNCGRLPNDLRWPYCDWTREIPQSVRDNWNKWATKELGLQLDQEPEELTIVYMLGSKKANDRLKVLQDYVRRLEKAFLAVLSEDENRKDCDCSVCKRMRQDAQAALEKIRRG